MVQDGLIRRDTDEHGHGTRAPDDDAGGFDPNAPRLGRRESEPHSIEVSYLHDVLATNYPEDRATWDLHHYFMLDGEEIDLRFDVSFFKGLRIDHTLSSYRAAEHGGRVPDLVINILSKSTWPLDVGVTVETCQAIGIPVYVIFAPYDVASTIYRPPFLRAHVSGDNSGRYQVHELRAVTVKQGGAVDRNRVIDCGARFPFMFGLMELERKHARGLPLYRLVLIDRESREILLTRAEQEKRRADQYLKILKDRGIEP
ncbi:MAG: Uma2 family endonuclease [Candidatus Sigynarchaeota archaeon]